MWPSYISDKDLALCREIERQIKEHEEKIGVKESCIVCGRKADVIMYMIDEILALRKQKNFPLLKIEPGKMIELQMSETILHEITSLWKAIAATTAVMAIGFIVFWIRIYFG